MWSRPNCLLYSNEVCWTSTFWKISGLIKFQVQSLIKFQVQSLSSMVITCDKFYHFWFLSSKISFLIDLSNWISISTLGGYTKCIEIGPMVQDGWYLFRRPYNMQVQAKKAVHYNQLMLCNIWIQSLVSLSKLIDGFPIISCDNA